MASFLCVESYSFIYEFQIVAFASQMQIKIARLLHGQNKEIIYQIKSYLISNLLQ